MDARCDFFFFWSLEYDFEALLKPAIHAQLFLQLEVVCSGYPFKKKKKKRLLYGGKM